MLYPVIYAHADSLNLGTSLSAVQQFHLEEIFMKQDIAEIQLSLEPEAVEKPKGGKLVGCWVDGKLRFQSRDRDAIDEYAARRMSERHSVWVAPVGSFVIV